MELKDAFDFWLDDNRERLEKAGLVGADMKRAAVEEYEKLTDKTPWEQKADDELRRLKEQQQEKQ